MEWVAYIAGVPHSDAPPCVCPVLRRFMLQVNDPEEPDATCLELGAAIFYDKPIIVVAPAGREVPAGLRRIATTVIEGDLADEGMAAAVAAAIREVVGE